MNRKEKKALGVLHFQIIFGVRKLIKEGVIDKDTTPAQAAVIYMAQVASEEETYAAWEAVEVGEVDWNALLAFIEKLLAILLPLFT